MFENLSKLLKIPETANPTLKKDAVAVLPKTSPETLAAFEEAYSKRPITSDWGMNSRHVLTANSGVTLRIADQKFVNVNGKMGHPQE